MSSRRPTVLPALALAVAVGSALVLTGCTIGPSDSDTAPSGSPTPTLTQTAAPDDSQVAPSLQPVMVVAGVDVDGKNVTVSGYVAGILETGGECTYSFVGNTAVPSVGSAGVADRNSTSCGSVQAPFDEFTRGTWKVILHYTALSGQSSDSEPLALEIP